MELSSKVAHRQHILKNEGCLIQPLFMQGLIEIQYVKRWENPQMPSQLRK